MGNLFLFENIIYLSDEQIQDVLREIDAILLAKALKTKNDYVKNAIFRNMSSRAVSLLKEDIEFMGPVRMTDVEKSQQDIIKMIFKLFAKDNRLELEVCGEKKEYLYEDCVNFKKPEKQKYEVLNGTSPSGKNFEVNFEWLKSMNIQNKESLFRKFFLEDIYLATRYCDFANEVLPQFSDRTKSYLEEKFGEYTKEQSVSCQMKITEEIKRMMESGECSVPGEISFEDVTLFNDRSIQTALRNISATTEEKKNSINDEVKKYMSILDMKKLQKDDVFIDSVYYGLDESDGKDISSDVVAYVMFGVDDFCRDVNDYVSFDFDEQNAAKEEQTYRKNREIEICNTYHINKKTLARLVDERKDFIEKYCAANYYSMACALKTASSDVFDKFVRNMSKRFARELLVAINAINPSQEEIEENQKIILDVFRSLWNSGEIYMTAGTDILC